MFPFVGVSRFKAANRISGIGNIVLPSIGVSGSASLGLDAQGAFSLARVSASGSASVIIPSSGSAALSKISVSGSASAVTPYFDSYYSSVDYVPKMPADIAAVGQAFSLGSAKTLTEIGFYLAGERGISGYYYFELFACSGTPGSNGVPTGSALVSVSGNSGVYLYPSFYLVPVAVSNYSMAAGNYVVTARWTGTNNLYAGVDSTSPTHGGNYCYKSGSTWYADSNKDMSFQLKGV